VIEHRAPFLRWIKWFLRGYGLGDERTGTSSSELIAFWSRLRSDFAGTPFGSILGLASDIVRNEQKLFPSGRSLPSDEPIPVFDLEGSRGPAQAGDNLAMEKGQVPHMLPQPVWAAQGNDGLNEINILRFEIPRSVPEKDRIHNILLVSEELYTTLSILSSAFSLFFFQRAFFKGLKCYKFIYCLVAFFILTIPVSQKELFVAPYFEGKVITIIVGPSPGGVMTSSFPANRRSWDFLI
jgi:hypothetical protein